MVTFSISRTHQAFTHEFAWSTEADRTSGSETVNDLTCCVIDSTNQNLYIGQSRGQICQLNLLELGTHSPRLLGKHDGLVKGICIYTYAGSRTQKPVNLVVSCSADSTIKIWTHDPKTLHSTKPCLQTLYGHTAAVTCVSTVHQYLVSGAADGSVLLWRTTDTGLLALPQFQVAAKLWSSSHWVLSLTCQQQPADAGAGQGLFVAAANMSLLRIQFDKRAMQCNASCQVQVQAFGGAQNSGSSGKGALRGTADSPAPAGTSSPRSCSRNSSIDSKNSSGGNSHLQPSSPHTGNSSAALQQATAAARSQDLSIFAVKYMAHELAVLTLAYDDCCRLHSAVDGGVRCVWRSPGRSKFVAVDCTGTAGEVLIGDDHGALYVCSPHSEQLLAIKQTAQTPITAIVCCGTRAINKPSNAGSSSGQTGGSQNSESSVTEFVVLSGEGMGLWQLRRGLSYDVLPGGHKQSVIAVLVCQAHVLLDLSVLQPQSPTDPSAAAAATSASSSTLPTTQPLRSIPGTAGDRTADAADATASADTTSFSRSSFSDLYTLISVGLDNRALQWDLAQGPSVLSSVEADEGGSELSAMTYLQNWAILATGHEDGQIRLWRMDTGSYSVLSPTIHSNTVCSLAPALNAKGDELLLSGDYDGCVALWEPRQLRGAKPHMITRFQAFGLTAEELLESYQLTRLADSSNTSNSSANRSRLHSARRKRPGTNSAAGGTAGVPGVSVAGSSMPSMCSTPQLGAQRIAEVGGYIASSSTRSVLQKAAISSISGISASSKAGQLQPQQAALAAGPGYHKQGRNELGSPVSTLGGLAGAAKQESPSWHGQLQQYSAIWSDVRLQGGRSSPRGTNMLQGVMGIGTAVTESSEVLVIMFDRAQQVVVTGGNSGIIRVWSSSCTGELLGQHLGHTGPVNCLNTDGNFLFSGSSDISIRIWDLLPSHFASKGSNAAQGGAASSSGTQECALDSADGCMGGGTAPGGMVAISARPPTSWELYLQEIGSGSPPSSSGRNSPSQTAARYQTSSSPGLAMSCDIVPRSIAFDVLQGHTAAVTGLDVVRSTGVLVSCGKDGRILQWDYTSGQLLMQQQLPGMEFTCVSVQQDSKQAYVGTSKGQILGLRVGAPAVGSSSSDTLPSSDPLT